MSALPGGVATNELEERRWLEPKTHTHTAKNTHTHARSHRGMLQQADLRRCTFAQETRANRFKNIQSLASSPVAEKT